jgi:hypothetical protein
LLALLSFSEYAPTLNREDKMIIRLILVAVLLNVASATIASAGPCDRSTDRASDGSRCGDRAADRRPGGR